MFQKLNNISITKYLKNGGASLNNTFNFDDYDCDDDGVNLELEKLGLFLDEKLKECINVSLFNPDTTTAFYHQNSDVLTIYIIDKRIGTNLFCINIFHFECVGYYNFDECEDLYFEKWLDFIFFLKNSVK